MQYLPLGRTGIHVSRFCLGTANFGKWAVSDERECTCLVHAAIDGGVNFFDSADAYSDGEAETLLGKALRGRRDKAIIATKFRYPMGPDVNQSGCSRRWIVQAVEGSLRRLGTEWIDLYQMHGQDPSTDIDETLGALSDLVREGKVRAIGSSAFAGEDLLRARWVAERRAREFLSTEQPPYSIFVREAENHVLPTCAELNLGVIGWGSLNGGWLSGKYRHGEQPPADSRAMRWPVGRQRFEFERAGAQAKLDKVEDLSTIADEAGVSVTGLALGFALEHPAITSVLIGPRTPEQLEDVLAHAGARLSEETLDAIDSIVPPGTTVDRADLLSYSLPGLDLASRRRGRATDELAAVGASDFWAGRTRRFD